MWVCGMGDNVVDIVEKYSLQHHVILQFSILCTCYSPYLEYNGLEYNGLSA